MAGSDGASLEDSIYGKTLKCPVCEMEFKSPTLKKGKTKLVTQETDFKNNFEPIDPMYYDVVICFGCGYGTVSHLFDKITSKKIDKMLEWKEKPRYKEYPLVLSTADALERYQHALQVAEYLERPDSEKAIICSCIAWIYRDLAEKTEEKRHMAMAVNSFIQAIQNEKPPYSGYDEGRVKIMVGDFLRRLGKKEESSRWIGSVIVNQMSLPQHKAKALEIKELLKEM